MLSTTLFTLDSVEPNYPTSVDKSWKMALLYAKDSSEGGNLALLPLSV